MIATINIPEDGDVDRITANLCLTAAAEYANRNGLVIVGERDETGKVVYWFERRRNHDHK